MVCYSPMPYFPYAARGTMLPGMDEASEAQMQYAAYLARGQDLPPVATSDAPGEPEATAPKSAAPAKPFFPAVDLQEDEK